MKKHAVCFCFADIQCEKVTFVGDSFVRKPPKYERFIRPTGLRFKKAHVTHPDLKATFYLDILGVKKNPSSQT
jgi:ribosome biogenesis protein NSA2